MLAVKGKQFQPTWVCLEFCLVFKLRLNKSHQTRDCLLSLSSRFRLLMSLRSNTHVMSVVSYKKGSSSCVLQLYFAFSLSFHELSAHKVECRCKYWKLCHEKVRANFFKVGKLVLPGCIRVFYASENISSPTLLLLTRSS